MKDIGGVIVFEYWRRLPMVLWREDIVLLIYVVVEVGHTASGWISGVGGIG